MGSCTISTTHSNSQEILTLDQANHSENIDPLQTDFKSIPDKFFHILHEITSQQLAITASKGILMPYQSNLTIKQSDQVLQTNKEQQFRQKNKVLEDRIYIYQSVTEIVKQNNSLQIKGSCFNLARQIPKKEYKKVLVNVSDFIKIRHESIQNYYQLNDKIGEGTFGCVYKGLCLKSAQPRAIKILKKQIINQKVKQQMLAQMNLLKNMDHPNIIKLYDLFYYNQYYYIVTQLCEGGQILRMMEKNKNYSQKVLSIIMKQLLSVVSYIHSKKITHRDLKLQNIIFSKKVDFEKIDQNLLDIKIIDFGLAVSMKSSIEKIDQISGTLMYMPPQALDRFLSDKYDIWSCGIILYTLLVGKFPYKSQAKKELTKQIKNLEIDFTNQSFKNVTNQAQNLLRLLLQPKPHLRASAEKLLEHQWFIKNKNRRNRISQICLSRKQQLKVLFQYNSENSLQNVIKSYITFKNITEEQRCQLAEAFKMVDKDNSGMIDAEELAEVYFKFTGQRNQQTIRKLINQIDQNKSGRIDFSQFLVVMYCKTKNLLDKQIGQAFDYFDTDKNNFIEKKQLKNILKGCESEYISDIFKSLDKNGDQKISKQELIEYFKSSW